MLDKKKYELNNLIAQNEEVNSLIAQNEDVKVDPVLLRNDGRLENEMRKLGFNITSGMGYEMVTYSQGLTTVEVYIDNSDSKDSHEVILSFNENYRIEKLHERRIWEHKFKLEKIINSQIVDVKKYYKININIIQDNGSLFSAIVNATTLCLCYSGIQCNDLFISATFNNSIDLNFIEESNNSSIVLVYSINKNKCSYLETQGKIRADLLRKYLCNGVEAIIFLSEHIKNFLR